MKRIHLLFLALSLVSSGHALADGFSDLQRNQAVQDSLELQREQLRLQREQLELLRGINEQGQGQAAKRKNLDSQIKSIIDKNVSEQYATFLKLYPIYATDRIRAAALTIAVEELQNSPQFADRRLDLSAFTEILLEAHKIVVRYFGDF